MKKEIFEQSYKWEKGLVNHPNDKGGWTNDGITIKFYNTWCRVVLNTKPSNEHFSKMKKYPHIFKFYSHLFERVLCHRISNWVVSAICFDFILNSGMARREIQNVLRDIGHTEVIADNIFGAITIGALNEAIEKIGALKICELILDKRQAYIEMLIERDKSQEVFRKGWMNRINDMRDFVKKNLENLKKD